MSYFVAYIFVATVFFVHAYKYKTEMDLVYAFESDCEKIPGKGIDKIFDLSNFSLEKKNDDVFINGFATFLWNEGGQFRRVEARGVTERYQRGSWGPTTYNLLLPDLCTTMFDKTTPWYIAFFSHVKEEFRNCSYSKGYKLEFEPFMLDPVEIIVPGVDMTGKYRILIYLIPYDKNNMKMVESIYCFTVPLESVRIS